MSRVKKPLLMLELRKSRRKQQPGDLFVFKFRDEGYFYGRVISTDVKMFNQDCLLLYIYKLRSPEMNMPEEGELRVETSHDLLTPPLVTDSDAWRDGYYETIANIPLAEDHVLSSHYFYQSGMVEETFVDEYWNKYDSAPEEPYGLWVFSPYVAIERDVANALNIPIDSKVPDATPTGSGKADVDVTQTAELRKHEFDDSFSVTLECGTPSDEAILDAGHEPSGYFWETIAQLLVSTEAPTLETQLSYDSEGSMFCAVSDEEGPVDALAALMTSVVNDPERVTALIETAAQMGIEFDD